MAPDDRRDAIVAATLPLLRTSGPAVTTKEIAAAAGVSEGTVFRVFETKDDLIVACVAQAVDTTQVRTALRAVDRSLPLAVRLAAGVGIMRGHLDGVVSLMSVLHASGVRMPQPGGREGAGPGRRRGNPEIDAEFVDLIGCDAERLRVPVERVVTYLGMLTLASIHPILPDSHATADEVVDVLLHGVLSSDAVPGSTESETS